MTQNIRDLLWMAPKGKALHWIGVWARAYGMHMCVWYGAGLGLICDIKTLGFIIIFPNCSNMQRSHCCTALQCITVCIGPSMHVCRQQLVLFQEELKIDYLPKMMNKHLIMLIIIFLITLQY